MQLNFSDLMRSLIVTIITISYLTVPAWSAEGNQSQTSSTENTQEKQTDEEKKKKEKPEFEITCSDENYLTIIKFFIEKLQLARKNTLIIKNRYEQDIAKGLDPGTKDLKLPSNVFDAPEDLSAVVFGHKAFAFYKARSDYLEGVEHRSAARVFQFYEDLQIALKNVVLSANKQCKKLEDRRAAAIERGEGVTRGTTYASSENHVSK